MKIQDLAQSNLDKIEKEIQKSKARLIEAINNDVTGFQGISVAAIQYEALIVRTSFLRLNLMGIIDDGDLDSRINNAMMTLIHLHDVEQNDIAHPPHVAQASQWKTEGIILALQSLTKIKEQAN